MAAADAVPVQRTALPLQRGSQASAVTPQLRLSVERPEPGAAVVHVLGELDGITAPRLTELLAARLRGTLRTLVVDLRDVDFLGAAGLSTLLYADLLARQRHIALCVLADGNRAVNRILEITGVDRRLTVRRTPAC
ncbi:STAS domain-containing protein [Amycolatopsis dongchuanensis]|uniref:STAS domain-containing protein n=1 Tax=Amycolatopsis TaxID=1813 RepID=UPI0031F73F49